MYKYEASARIIDDDNIVWGFEFNRSSIISDDQLRIKLNSGHNDYDVETWGKKFRLKGNRKMNSIPRKKKNSTQSLSSAEEKNQINETKIQLNTSTVTQERDNENGNDNTESKVFLWVEDTGNGRKFWEWLWPKLSENSTVMPKQINRGEWNGDSLINKAYELNQTITDDKHIILIDNPWNNRRIREKVKNLLQAHTNPNLLIVTQYSGFESILLSFAKLEDWITKTRKQPFSADELRWLNGFRAILFSNNTPYYATVVSDYRQVHPKRFKQTQESDNITIENFAKALIHTLTENAKGFRITLSQTGECWTNSCLPKCKYPYFECDLNYTEEQKAKELYKESYLSDIFEKEGIVNVANICI